MKFSARRFGTRALLVDVPGEISGSGARMRALRERVASRSGLDVVVGDGVLLAVGTDFEEFLAVFEEELEDDIVASDPEQHIFDVVYDGADLGELARKIGVTKEEVVALHTKPTYEVAFLGFMPGFPYLRGLDERLVVPRRSAPRPRVLAGSVAIAAKYAGIYPFDGPGGWNLVGRLVGTKLFESSRSVPARLAPGDLVRFRALEISPPAEPLFRARAEPPETPVLRVLRAPPLTTIQDEGRFGKLGLGLPPSGAADPDLFRRTVLSVDALGSAAIEFSSGSLHLEALAACTLSLDGDPLSLEKGEVLVVEEAERLYRYVAVDGGISVPEVLGSRSTHVGAKLGGFLGRSLRAGDILGRAEIRVNARGESVELREEVLVEPGPDYERFSERAHRTLFDAEFEIDTAFDRSGVRLTGASLGDNALGSGRSIPMIRGAIQVTPSGAPIVLGPDHPTTGGYPVIAVLAEESFGAFARLRPGTRFRFEPKTG